MYSSTFHGNIHSSTVSTSRFKLDHDLVPVCPHINENYKYPLSLSVTDSPKYRVRKVG